MEARGCHFRHLQLDFEFAEKVVALLEQVEVLVLRAVEMEQGLERKGSEVE